MAETETVNPEQGTEPVEQDGSIDSAAQAILQADEKQDEDYESPRPNEPEQKDDGVDAGVEDEVEEEDQTDTPLYTVKVDGKEVDVTLDELQSGYLKDSDYRKKTGEIAEQRRAMESQSQAIQQERAQYAQALGQMQSEAARRRVLLTRLSSSEW